MNEIGQNKLTDLKLQKKKSIIGSVSVDEMTWHKRSVIRKKLH